MKKSVLSLMLTIGSLSFCHAQEPASDLYKQGAQLYLSGRYEEAVKVLEQSDGGSNAATLLLMSYVRLADAQVTKNDSLALVYLAKAEEWGGKCDPSVDGVEELRRSIYPLMASAYSSQSIDCYDRSDFMQSLALGKKALELRRKYLGERHPSFVSSLTLTAKTCGALGRYEEAVALTNQALQVTEETNGKDSGEYATRLGNLAVFYSDMGNYAEAVRLCNEALQLTERHFGKESLKYAVTLSNLASIYHKLGNNHEALRYSREVLRLKERLVGKESSSYATSLANHAQYVAAKGDLEEALNLSFQAFTIQQKTDGLLSPACATTLNDLAYFNGMAEHYDNAAKLQASHLEVISRLMGRQHPDYALSLNNLAAYTAMSGDLTKAEEYARLAEELCGKIFDKSHPTAAMNQRILADLSFFQGKCPELERHSNEAIQRFSDYVLSAFPGLSVTERKYLWSQYENWFNDINLFAATYPTPALAASAYNGMLLSKGLLLNSDMEMMRLIRESGDQQALQAYEQLAADRRHLQKLMQLPRNQRGSVADSLFREVIQRERMLSSRSKDFGDYSRNLQLQWKDVQRHLRKEDVAVEFCHYPDLHGRMGYLALVLTREMSAPAVVLLFHDDELKEMLSHDIYASDVLTQRLWNPVMEKAKGKKRIYFAPDGELYRLGIESLPVAGGKGLLADQWEFYRLSSTRLLAASNASAPIRQSVVYGGLEYDTDAKVLEAESERYAGVETVNPVDEPSALPEDLNLRAGIGYLPGTKMEAADIDSLLTVAKIQTTLYTQSQGTETSFKALSGKGVNLLHIATHGFFWTDRETRRLKNVHFLEADTRSFTLENKGMARSGLLFAGANTSLRGVALPKNVDDGILTAQEISQLDFRGMDIVVMSACQTGLGDITGDGVFGLQRGFKKAGARTLMMSLWKVDDQATHLLMDEFYRQLTHSKSKHDAFTAAQRYLRTTADGKYSAPRFWAAFILLDAV